MVLSYIKELLWGKGSKNKNKQWKIKWINLKEVYKIRQKNYPYEVATCS